MAVYQNIIRISKVVAVKYEKIPMPEGTGTGQYWALLDGGHEVPVDSDAAESLIASIELANDSDLSFFGRGG